MHISFTRREMLVCNKKPFYKNFPHHNITFKQTDTGIVHYDYHSLVQIKEYKLNGWKYL
jgi:hypothetical protein